MADMIPIIRKIEEAFETVAKEIYGLEQDLRDINSELLPPSPEVESEEEKEEHSQGWFEHKLKDLLRFRNKLYSIRQRSIRLKLAVDVGKVKKSDY